MKFKLPSMKKITVTVPGAVDSVVAKTEGIIARFVRFLNGNINIKFVNHPAFRWGFVAIIALYILIGVVVGWKVYKVKAESTNVRRILTLYPFPAALMPQDVILVRDYLNQLKFIRHFADKTKQALPPDIELRQQLLSQMVETRLLLRSVKHYGIRVSKADIDAAYKKIADENGGQQELSKLLTDLYGMKESEFRLLIRDQLLREKIKQELLTQVKASHILIRDEKKAREVLDQIKADPAKFGELAKQQSEDTANRDNSGDLGLFGRGVMAKEFEDVAFKMKKDEVHQDLVKTEFGFHIIKVTDRHGSLDKTYADFVKELRTGKTVWTLLK